MQKHTSKAFAADLEALQEKILGPLEPAQVEHP